MGEVLRSSRPFVTSARLAIAPRTIDEMRALRDVEQDPEMRQAYSEMVAAMEPLGDADYWACDWLISRADGASVGGIGFKGAPDIRGCVEVGYGIDEAFQRRGYATEATRAMVEWALVQPGVRSVVAQAEPQNAISQKVLLASGFVRDGMGEEGPLFRRLSCTSEDSAGTLAIRDIRADELSLLEDFLYEAIFIPEEITPPQCSVIREPLLWRTIDGFGTLPDDRCLVAEVAGQVVGAVWCRTTDQYGHVDSETPSFSIALYPEFRGRGIGTALMRAMLVHLTEAGYARASLSVQKANYAKRMYESLGFEIVGEKDGELVMVRQLERHIGLCGDNCSACPRRLARSDDELERVAELWVRLGWRDEVETPAALRCEGCSSTGANCGRDGRCVFGLWECVAAHSVGSCHECAEWPCERLRRIAEEGDAQEDAVREVCTPEGFAVLSRAFLRKRKNLGIE